MILKNKDRRQPIFIITSSYTKAMRNITLSSEKIKRLVDALYDKKDATYDEKVLRLYLFLELMKRKLRSLKIEGLEI